MKTFGIIISALLTAAFMFLGKERNPNFYLAAMTAVWLMSKLGVKGLACPSDYKK